MALTEEGILHVPGLLSRWVRLPGGTKAHYVTAGETGPAVVLLHGGLFGSSGTAGWKDIAPGLAAAGYRVYAPDFPTFGLTQDPGGAYQGGLASQVEFVHDFANALLLDSFHLVGNSMGCAIGSHYVVAHPDRVLSFAGLAGRFGDVVPFELETAADTRPPESRPNPDVLFDGSPESMRRVLETIILRKEVLTDDLLRMRTDAANTHLAQYRTTIGRMFAGLSGTGPADEAAQLRTRDRLDRIALPMIYVFGREDALLPLPVAHVQEDHLPNIQFFYPEGCGHQSQTDRPDIHVDLFAEFFGPEPISWETAQRCGISDRRPPIPGLVAQP